MSNYRPTLHELYSSVCDQNNLSSNVITFTVSEVSTNIVQTSEVELPLRLSVNLSNLFCFYKLLGSIPIMFNNKLDILRTLAKIPSGSITIDPSLDFNFFNYMRSIEIYLNLVLISEVIPLSEKSAIVDFLKGKPLMKDLKEQLFNTSRNASLAAQLGIKQDDNSVQETVTQASQEASVKPLSEQLNSTASDNTPRTRQLFGGQVTINV